MLLHFLTEHVTQRKFKKTQLKTKEQQHQGFSTHLVIAQTVQKPHAQKQISCNSVWPDEIGPVPPLDLEGCKDSTRLVKD